VKRKVVEEICRCHTSLQKSKGAQFGVAGICLKARVRQVLKKFARAGKKARKGRFKEDRKRQRGVPCADDSLNSPDCIPPIPHM